jgi:hypothetical protein
VRRGRVFPAFAVVLVLGAAGVWATSSAAEAPEKPDARCVREGLAPIPVTLRASADRHEGIGRPTLKVQWSGKPLAARCGSQRSVSIDFTLWFPHLRFWFTEGFPSPWLEFWNGRKAVHDGEENYVSNASYDGLGCLRKAHARLRYEVTAPDGSTLGKRVVSAPVKIPACSE